MTEKTTLTLERLRPSVYPDPASQDAFNTEWNLAESEWFARERLEQDQLSHLRNLAYFAAQATPYWRTRLNVDGFLRAATLQDALSLVPTLSRAELIANSEALRATALPVGHKIVGELKTSGSTGAVVAILTTDFSIKRQNALTFRAHLWAGRDFSRTLAIVRRFPRGVAEHPNGIDASYWDGPTVFPFPTGPAFHLNTHNASLDQIWDWMARVKPGYLLTYPSIVRGFAERVARQECQPLPLLSISTISEVVDQELRERAVQYLGAPVYDIYSSQEAGSMAIQCPVSGAYHIQSETVIVEILDERNRPCGPGEIGRVVVTPLFNCGTPLFRYEMGDFAEAGAPCACGRGLPVINRVVGRRRNLLTLPDGRRFWPSLGARYMQKIVPFREHQFRQTAPDVIEVLLVTDEDITPAQEAEMRKIVAGSLPGTLDIRIHRVSEIPRPASGKHEEFVSTLA